jgi:hypothetical protein
MLPIFAVRPPAKASEIAADVRVDPAMADEIERSLHLRLPPR